MKEIIENNKDNISSMIYEIRGKQVMIDSEIAVTKCYSDYDNVITHYDIGNQYQCFPYILNFRDVSAKLERWC